MDQVATKAPPNSQSSTVERSLDHFVVMARDLYNGSEAYRRLGFRVLPIMEHEELGTSNVVIQFNNTYLEIISDFDKCKVPHVTERNAAWMGSQNAYWMTSFTSRCLEDDRSLLEHAGLDVRPISSARRHVRLPGSGWIDTASRSMYMWNESRITTSLFVSDHPRPEAIWIPEYLCHPNSATHVLGVRYAVNDPQLNLAYYSGVIGREPVTSSPDEVRYETPRGEFFELLTPELAQQRLAGQFEYPAGLAGIGASLTFAVDDLLRARWALRDGGVPFAECGGELIVPSSHACGVCIAFRQV